jgi:hypothetical protein
VDLRAPLWRARTGFSASFRGLSLKSTKKRNGIGSVLFFFPEQYLILVKCRDEKDQVEWLGRLASQGLECRALLS